VSCLTGTTWNQVGRHSEQRKIDGESCIALSHPWLGKGGSEARVAWGLQALAEPGPVHLLTGGGRSVQELNDAYGSRVSPDDVVVRRPLLGRMVGWLRSGHALRGTVYQRFCRFVATDYDVLISAYNLVDFGVPGIHCIADFSWDDEVRRSLHPDPPGMRGRFHRSGLRRYYLALCRAIAKPSGRNLFAGEDMILSNSRWTAGIIHERHGLATEVLYPPVAAKFPDVPPAARGSGFVCIGRIAPEKRVERMIEIVERVRARGHDVHLHVIGGLYGAYGQQVRRLAQAREPWVILEGARYGAEKAHLLAGHRWGIHACQGEAFGIAVAEMVKAGCVTFVPAEGGQAEIVDHPALMYRSVDEAVAKIDAVLRTPALQAELRTHLADQGELFSAERFMVGIRQAVETFLATRGSQREVGR